MMGDLNFSGTIVMQLCWLEDEQRPIVYHVDGAFMLDVVGDVESILAGKDYDKIRYEVGDWPDLEDGRRYVSEVVLEDEDDMGAWAVTFSETSPTPSVIESGDPGDAPFLKDEDIPF